MAPVDAMCHPGMAPVGAMCHTGMALVDAMCHPIVWSGCLLDESHLDNVIVPKEG